MSQAQGPLVLHADDLARVHDVVRVQRHLQGPHDADRVAEFGLQKFHFAEADAVLASGVRMNSNILLRVPASTILGRSLARRRVKVAGSAWRVFRIRMGDDG